MLNDPGIPQQNMATLYCDNQSIIKEVGNNRNSQELKQLAKKTRSIAEWVDRGRLQLEYVPATKNIADIFTKASGPCVFERLCDQLNLEGVRNAMASESEVEGVATTAKNSNCVSDVDMSDT
ncbi:hypothetical protein PI124_g10382 [Phytophthora idaei]|nr:hypothetical protein PI125_g9931 [Phytophthora idaei]KAG3157695.1 hypothetical protein PI126_g8172 [Phytophthora idaei]KAG3244860.1 hypothetical protein PI124_g10382 [Phytophthora idaei]